MTLELFQLHRVASDVFVLLELLKDPILQERGQDFCFEFGPQKRNPAITMESGRLAFFLGLLWGRFMLSNGNLECDFKKKKDLKNSRTKTKKSNSTPNFVGQRNNSSCSGCKVQTIPRYHSLIHGKISVDQDRTWN